MPKVFRKEMLESQILSILAEALLHWKNEDIEKQFISFTRAQLSKDKRYLEVYVSVFDKSNDASNVEKTFSKIEKNAGYFKTHLSRSLKIFTVPELRFKLDSGIAQSVHIQQVLDSLKISKENQSVL